MASSIPLLSVSWLPWLVQRSCNGSRRRRRGRRRERRRIRHCRGSGMVSAAQRLARRDTLIVLTLSIMHILDYNSASLHAPVVAAAAAIIDLPHKKPAKQWSILQGPSNIAAGFLDQTLQTQSDRTRFHPSLAHAHRQFLEASYGSSTTATNVVEPGSLSHYVRVGLAGGIAGATGTLALYPIDAAKTLRQSNPRKFPSVRAALHELLYNSNNNNHVISLRRLYHGVLPATLGAIPSSALYFGAYESMKTLIGSVLAPTTDKTQMSSRLWVHGLSAAAGNVLSSLVFVPKELVKQQMQYQGHGHSVGQVCLNVVRTNGVRGLYTGYQATLMRNIPSAMLRFVLYEEFKYHWYIKHEEPKNAATVTPSFHPRLFLAGALAGALASGLLTPIDVFKTRLATGTCPVEHGVRGCLSHVLQEQGVRGLYAGAGSRIVWSGAFSAIGFGSLEAAKGWLGVRDVVRPIDNHQSNPRQKSGGSRFSEHSRTLQHALTYALEDKK